jgi:DNA-binding NarL/FixJ family response regulator
VSVVALVDDLMFLSRIREAARRQSLEVRAVRTADALVDACRAGARVVIVDLDSRRLPAAEALSALRADPALAEVPTIGFFSHVETERAREARDNGCRTVLPRSAFVQRLDALLAAPSGDGREPGAGA